MLFLLTKQYFMSIKERRPVEEEMGINQVEDTEIAREGAEAEKYLKDVAREPHVTEEEKDILDCLAERKGEEATNQN
jgi:hypothetical protein